MALPGLTIGQAAKAAGVSPKAIRVYEANARRRATAASYRLYDAHDVELLTFIRRARTLGLHLNDVRDVLAIRDGGTPPCATVRGLLDARIAEIDTAVAELLALCETLTDTRRRADDCTEEGPVSICTIIETPLQQ